MLMCSEFLLFLNESKLTKKFSVNIDIYNPNKSPINPQQCNGILTPTSLRIAGFGGFQFIELPPKLKRKWNKTKYNFHASWASKIASYKCLEWYQWNNKHPMCTGMSMCIFRTLSSNRTPGVKSRETRPGSAVVSIPQLHLLSELWFFTFNNYIKPCLFWDPFFGYGPCYIRYLKVSHLNQVH